MAQIVPKLNLNKTPNLVENNSLVFASNIRVDVDGSIHRDYGISPLSLTDGKFVNEKVYLKNILGRIVRDLKWEYTNIITNNIQRNKVINIWFYLNNHKELVSNYNTDDVFKIVGVIPDSNDFYLFIHSNSTKTIRLQRGFIFKYSEKDDLFYYCDCNWNWSGGEINGYVTKNLIGDTILNIGETNIATLVPFKSINLNEASDEDDESIYTQTPNIPLLNIYYGGDFSYIIPNGVYTFYVRYKIRENFYTDWFPASHPIYVGNNNTISTNFGTLGYVNTHRDSDNSFILNLEYANKAYKKNYKQIQLGFILTHDDATYARAWKHFDINRENNIYFDYKPEDAIEIQPSELLNITYGIYNVGNITSFKNKLYISNYTETNFDEEFLQTYADKITATPNYEKGDNTYAGYSTIDFIVSSKKVIRGLIVDNKEIYFTGKDGIFSKICTNGGNDSIEKNIEIALSGGNVSTLVMSKDVNGIRINGNFQSLTQAKSEFQKNYIDENKTDFKRTYEITYPSDNVTNVKYNGVKITGTKDAIVSRIYNDQRYLTRDGRWIDGQNNNANVITITITRSAKVKVTTTSYNGFQSAITEEIESNQPISTFAIQRPGSSNNGIPTIDVKTYDYTYDQTIVLNFIAMSDFVTNDGLNLINRSSLIPYQSYKFYVHYIKYTGEITNGYECRGIGELTAPYMSVCNSVIYPIFKNIEIPQGYEGCFISILHSKNKVSTIYQIEDRSDSNLKESSSIDIDMMLNPGYKNIHIKQGENETYSGTYHYSSDTNDVKYFGANGIITFENKATNNNSFDDKLAYAISNYNSSEADDLELIRCTPYLTNNNLTKFDDDTIGYNKSANMNLLGFICQILPLDRKTCINYYSDGGSVYYKEYAGDKLTFTELSKYNDADQNKQLGQFRFKTTNPIIIYSNYNLNFVTLSEEPKMNIKTYYLRGSNQINTDNLDSKDNDSRTNVLRLLSSQLMSDVYTLPTMYKTILNKTYQTYKNNSITKFNNTIRSSILYGDETKVNIIKFDAEDYYNMPANRGIITNLVSVGDSILVHTEDSMFKFIGSNTLQSTAGEVQQTESQPFDTGVSEVFGSDFGFAGLQNKKHSIITELGYIFYDSDSRIIYMYSGQGQIVKLSDSIEKLFKHKEIQNIAFANDYYNNRIFVNIVFYYEEWDDEADYDEDDYPIGGYVGYNIPVTLSFSILENFKSFVSIHNFKFNTSFSTKTNCYFINVDDILHIDKNLRGIYYKLAAITSIFPYKSKVLENSYLKEDDSSTTNKLKITTSQYCSIVDIINNSNYENIKTLNSIDWCSKIILNEYPSVSNFSLISNNMAEGSNDTLPCSYLRIYSDTCMTPLIEVTNRSNDYPPYDIIDRKPVGPETRSATHVVPNRYKVDLNLNSYKLPRYNQGIWSFNYFRNILNTKDSFKYLNKYDDGRREQTKTADYISDNNSLMEGKYFVASFYFYDDFKLETINFNYNFKQ